MRVAQAGLQACEIKETTMGPNRLAARMREMLAAGGWRWLPALIAAILLLPCCPVVLAQTPASTTPIASPASPAATWPARPIRIVLGMAAGGGTDLIARTLAPHLSARLGQPVLVENRAGASGVIAADLVAHAPADGYTLLFAPSGIMVANIVMKRSLPYSLADFAPVSLVCTFPLLLVTDPGLPAKTFAEFIAWLKANPSRANAGGSGPAFELLTSLFAQKVGAPLTFIPFKGSNESVQAIIARETSMAIVDVGPALGALRGNRLRALATSAPRRLPDFPEVPSVVELGYPDLEAEYWMGLFAPARTPPEVLRRLETEVHAVLREPQVGQVFTAKLVDVRPSTGPELGAKVAAEVVRWNAVRLAAGLPLVE
jgi:tripartite-type tricarboxylate transporter receptor subunit TctC